MSVLRIIVRFGQRGKGATLAEEIGAHVKGYSSRLAGRASTDYSNAVIQHVLGPGVNGKVLGIGYKITSLPIRSHRRLVRSLLGSRN